jgi:16S rRNA (guanine527-N7)-methyltransferase
VRVVRGRAEDLAGEIAADIVTARAVAPLDRLAGWAVGLCRPGGRVLAIKGASAEREVTESAATLRRLGITDVAVLRLGGGRVDLAGAAATVVSFRAPQRSGRAAAGKASARDRRRR